jgi:hypothetical protein
LHLEFICADAHVGGTGQEILLGQYQHSNHSAFTTVGKGSGAKCRTYQLRGKYGKEADVEENMLLVARGEFRRSLPVG